MLAAMLPARFYDKTRSEGGCVVWTGARDQKGYGQVWWDGRMVVAHRLAYERLVGPIPVGLQLDHLCRNRACVRPSHLEIVTGRENLLRGETLAARNAEAIECVNGHLFTPDNVYHWRGKRLCRTCRTDADHRRRAKAKGES